MSKQMFIQLFPTHTRCFKISAFRFVCDLLARITAFAKVLISAALLFCELHVACSFSNLVSLINDNPKRPVVVLRSS
jgi:hypothetical protein